MGLPTLLIIGHYRHFSVEFSSARRLTELILAEIGVMVPAGKISHYGSRCAKVAGIAPFEPFTWSLRRVGDVKNIMVNAAKSDILMRCHKKRQGCRNVPSTYKYV